MAPTLFIFRQAPELVSTILCFPSDYENSASVLVSEEGLRTSGGEEVNYQNLLRLVMDAGKIIIL